MRYIGIDPGVNGGIAAIESDRTVFGAMRMPETDESLLEAVDMFTADGTIQARVVIERVNAGVFGAGKRGQRMGAVSAFTFGGGYRAVCMAFLARGYRVEQVSPIIWQTALRCRTRGDKNVSKRRAIELFPTMRITHALADALLLAEFCRRTDPVVAVAENAK